MFISGGDSVAFDIDASGLVVAKAARKDAGGFGLGDPFAHAFGVPQGGEPFEQADEALALAPITLAKGIAQVLAARLGAAISAGGFMDGEE